MRSANTTSKDTSTLNKTTTNSKKPDASTTTVPKYQDKLDCSHHLIPSFTTKGRPEKDDITDTILFGDNYP
jgi:hypothetical protein